MSRRDARSHRPVQSGSPSTVWSRPASTPPAPAVDSAARPAVPNTPSNTMTDAAPARRARVEASARPAPGEVAPVEVAPVTETATVVAPSRRVRAPRPSAGAAAEAGSPMSADATRVMPPVVVPVEPFELLETIAEPVPETPAPAAAEQPEPVSEPRVAASGVDEFELAARLFAFTGETPVQYASTDLRSGLQSERSGAESSAPEAPSARRTRRSARQLATASFSIGVMGIVGLLTVGMTTPADAVAAVTGAEPPSVVLAGGDVAGDVDPEDIQAYVAPATLEHESIEREDSYSTVSLSDMASEQGITNFSNFFVNDPNAAIQWPFLVGVPITFGFGMRSGAMHEGADFVPGQGADIQAIAAGTVRTATNSGGGYGVEVIIDHIIDGRLVSSRYAHMLYGSLKVHEGQHVEAGTILGNTGNTGHSFGAHTHFEILQGGTTAIDPIAWLRANAGRYSLG